MTFNKKVSLLAGFVLFVFIIVLGVNFWGKKEVDKGPVQLRDLTPSEMLEEMTLEDKVGQMLMVGFWGEEPDYYINKMIDERNVGGVILLNYNLKNENQTRTLVDSLQNRSLETGIGIPLLISTDQEGGVVSKVKFLDATNTPQSEIESVDTAYSIAKERAIHLRRLGIYANYSPVLEYITDPNNFLFERTFRADSNQIGKLGIQMVRGYSDGGIISVPKHFPGHTNSSTDSHDELPESGLNEEELKEKVKPFRDVIDATNPEMIMTAHVLYPNIDSDPASLSSIFIRQMLKDDLGFHGIVITDDMEMGAILNNYSVAESAVKAVKSGNDILLYSSTPEKQVEAYEAIIEAVDNEVIPMDDIDSSVLKILELKKKFYY